MTKTLGRGVDALLQTGHPGVALAVLALQLGLTLFTGLVTLRDFPNSGDEYSYLLAAELFIEGRLWVPSPEPAEFFTLNHVISDGHFYSRYPPGWPLILAVGMLLHVPWLVNPVLGILAVALMHRMVRENFSSDVANAALYVTVGNPFLIFNSASYFSHPACLLFVTLFAYASLRCLKEPSVRVPYLLMGASLGAAFLIRPYTAAALALPFGIALLVNGVRAHRLHVLGKRSLLCVVPFTILFAAFLVYNHLQTGDALLPAFIKYEPAGRPFLIHWGWRRSLYSGYSPLRELNSWIPLSLPLLVAFFVPRETRRDPRAVLLLTSLLSLFVAYLLFQVDAGNRYGPRYLYEASFAVFILIGWLIVRGRRFAGPMLLVILCLNVYGFVTSTTFHAAQVRGRMNVYDVVKDQQISNAIVFLRTGSGTMGRHDLTRNGIHFNGPVLYVLDLGDRNSELLRAFPGRRPYVYRYERRSGTGSLTPYGRRSGCWRSVHTARKAIPARRAA